MARVHDRFLTLLVSAALLAGTAGTAHARSRVKYEKADPDKLAPHEIKDLHYGDVLFYFYQDDYFAAITRLLAARQQNRVPNHRDEAELLLGGLYLSLGEHVEAGRIFQELLATNAPLPVRNRAWYYLGKVWYQRGYLQESEKALGQISGAMDPRLDAERYMLLAQVLMTASLAVLVAVALLLGIVFDHPFTGDVQVSAEPFEHALREMSAPSPSP